MWFQNWQICLLTKLWSYKVFITWGGRTYNPTTHCTINFQCSNDPSHAHPQSPRHAPTNALKGQTPSAVGTALGNADFGCYRWGESHSPCFYILTEFHRYSVPVTITIVPRLRRLPTLRSVMSYRQVNYTAYLKRASALPRINIANIKTGRMRFAPTLTNVR